MASRNEYLANVGEVERFFRLVAYLSTSSFEVL